MQNKKECPLKLTHESYQLMNKIFSKYSEQHLQDILLNQFAYNCAIRAICLNEPYFYLEEFWDASSYGLNTYEGELCNENRYYRGEEDIISCSHRPSNLFLNYPFVNHEYYKTYGLQIKDRYPPISKPLDKTQKRILKEQLDADIESDAIFVPLTQKEKTYIKKLNGVIPTKANELTKAFYYFDAMEFFNCTQSMTSRTVSTTSTEIYQDGHDHRKIKEYKKVMDSFIFEKKYFKLL